MSIPFWWRGRKSARIIDDDQYKLLTAVVQLTRHDCYYLIMDTVVAVNIGISVQFSGRVRVYNVETIVNYSSNTNATAHDSHWYKLDNNL